MSKSDIESGSDSGFGSSGGGGWPGLPFVAPLAVFMVVTAVEKDLSGLLTQSGGYGLKLLATVLALWLYRGVWPRWDWRGVWWAALLGVAGVVLWVFLDGVQRQLLSVLNLADWLPARAGWKFDLSQLSVGEGLR
ncbi:MAG: hypothetical protein ACKPHU_13765, partial [Planctomycetaceae bacterium]